MTERAGPLSAEDVFLSVFPDEKFDECCSPEGKAGWQTQADRLNARLLARPSVPATEAILLRDLWDLLFPEGTHTEFDPPDAARWLDAYTDEVEAHTKRIAAVPPVISRQERLRELVKLLREAIHRDGTLNVLPGISRICSDMEAALATESAACPKCGGPTVSTHHGLYCPKPTCKWGWEMEMDGSPLKPPESAAEPGTPPRNCPTCDSPAPHLHPAIQHEGEVQPCKDAFHSIMTPQNRVAGPAQQPIEIQCPHGYVSGDCPKCTGSEPSVEALYICSNCGHGVAQHEWEDESVSSCLAENCKCSGYARAALRGTPSCPACERGEKTITPPHSGVVGTAPIHFPNGNVCTRTANPQPGKEEGGK